MTINNQFLKSSTKVNYTFALLNYTFVERYGTSQIKMGRVAFSHGRASPLSRDPASRSYERVSPPWRNLAIDYPRSRLGGLEIFHINALN